MSETNWLVVKLTRLGEQAEDNVLYAELKRIFGNDIDVFFPFKCPPMGYSRKVTVLDGYIFLRNYHDLGFELMDKSYYIEPLIVNSNSFVDAVYIAKLKEKLRSLCESEYYENEHVMVTDGPYSNLDGHIMSVSKRHVIIYISIRSRELMVEIPKSCIARYCPDMLF